MAEYAESVEELKAKLHQYREQLESVEVALDAITGESSLIKLRSDLKEVISLTEDLVSFQSGAAPDATCHSVVADASAEDGYSTNNGILLGGSVSSAVPFSSGRLGSSGVSLVGRTCVVSFQGAHCYAEIQLVKRDSKLGERAVVQLIGVGKAQEVPLSQIQMLQPPPPALCVPGTPCQAIYSEDGKWYDCVIEEQTESGYVVRYNEYGNKEEIKFDQVRLKTSSKKDSAKKKVQEVVTPAGYRIPEHLTIKETDTEQVKNTKKRKIQNLKKQQRLELRDEEAKVRAHCWRKFTQKTSKKKVAGFITGRPRESIFKSTDPTTKLALSSTPVQKPTSVFVPRRKHDFGDDADE